MPQIVITQTAQEYGAYTKKQARKQLTQAIAIIIIGVVFFAVVYWIAWTGVHIG